MRGTARNDQSFAAFGGFTMTVSFWMRIKKTVARDCFWRTPHGTAPARMAGVKKLWRVKYDY